MPNACELNSQSDAFSAARASVGGRRRNSENPSTTFSFRSYWPYANSKVRGERIQQALIVRFATHAKLIIHRSVIIFVGCFRDKRSHATRSSCSFALPRLSVTLNISTYFSDIKSLFSSFPLLHYHHLRTLEENIFHLVGRYRRLQKTIKFASFDV